MCQFQQLYSNESGYVVRCNKCSYYQILISGTMLSINQEEFDRFIWQISIQKQHNDFVDPKIKSILLPTPRPGVHLLLTRGEFGQLQHMMEAADAEIKALALIDLFQA